MKKMALVLAVWLLAVVCVAAGCGGVDFKEGVKVDVRSGESLPVQVEPQGSEGLPVTLNVQYDKPLPVKIEIPKEIIAALILAIVITLSALIIAVFALFAVRAAIRNVSDTQQSTDAKKAEQQKSGEDLHSAGSG